MILHHFLHVFMILPYVLLIIIHLEYEIHLFKI